MRARASTWNVAAINNNPFEYWITHDDPDYLKLMSDVQARPPPRAARRRGVPMASLTKNSAERRRRFNDAEAAVSAALEPSGVDQQRKPRPEDVRTVANKLGAGIEIGPAVMNRLVHAAGGTQAAGRKMRRALQDENIDVASEKQCAEQREEERQEKMPPTEYIFERGHEQRGDGARHLRHDALLQRVDLDGALR